MEEDIQNYLPPVIFVGHPVPYSLVRYLEE